MFSSSGLKNGQDLDISVRFGLGWGRGSGAMVVPQRGLPGMCVFLKKHCLLRLFLPKRGKIKPFTENDLVNKRKKVFLLLRLKRETSAICL